MAKAPLSKRERGIRAGLLTFFLGPPLGGAALGLAWTVWLVIVSAADILINRQTVGQVLGALPAIFLMPIVTAMWSFAVAAVPAAVAAIYVSFRVAVTARMSWTETIVLSIVCLVFIPGAQANVLHYDYLLRSWPAVLILGPSSLLAALTLRYLAGRWGLVR